MSKMPALFIGHGSPMNAIEDNSFTDNWRKIAGELPKPQGILCVSAHWVTRGSKVNDLAGPELVYDMYGFPRELYQVSYRAPGNPGLAGEVQGLIPGKITVDNSWGLDHGTWSVLCRMYPKADIPVMQLSLDAGATPQGHYQIGRALAPLRDRGILILGSGNVVHNLAELDYDRADGYPWAEEFDGYIKSAVLEGRHDRVMDYHGAGLSARKAFRTTEHFDPLLYVLGAAKPDENVSVFNDVCMMGSMSMTCYLFQGEGIRRQG